MSEPTPFELFTGRKPDISYIRRFGCVAYWKNPRSEATKFGVKGQKGIIVGSHPGAWLFLTIDENSNRTKIIRSADLEFTESVMFKDEFDNNLFEKFGYPSTDIFESDYQNEVLGDESEQADFEVVRIQKAKQLFKRFKRDFEVVDNSIKGNKDSASDEDVDKNIYEEKYQALMYSLTKSPQYYGQVK